MKRHFFLSSLFLIGLSGMVQAQPRPATQPNPSDRVASLEAKVAQLQKDVDLLKSQLGQKAILASPTTKPTTLGRILVTVVGNKANDVSDLRVQLKEMKDSLNEKQDRANELRNKAATMATETTVVHNPDGDVTRPKYDSRVMGDAQVAALNATNAVNIANQTIIRLQKQIDNEISSQTAVVTLENNQSAEIVGSGPAYKAMIEKMEIGKQYSIEGQRSVVNGKIIIQVKSVMPV